MKCINLNKKTYNCCKTKEGTTTSNIDSEVKIKNNNIISKIKSSAVRTGTFLLLCFPFTIFAFTVLDWYVEHYGWAIPIFSSLLFSFSLISFLISCFRNPGVIPGQRSTHLEYDLFKGHSNYPNVAYYSRDNILNNHGIDSNYRDLHMNIGGKLMKIKFCTTCNIFRSPRAVHCRICDVCVHRFDHHCKWLNNCIGYNNYRYFIAFIVSTFLLIIAILLFTIVRLIYIKMTPFVSTDNIRHSKMTKIFITNVFFITVLLLIIVSTGWFVIGLFIYHFHLIVTNQTTNEQLKGVFQSFNPHNRGFLNNLRDILFNKHNINYTHNINNSIYNPVSDFKDRADLSLITNYLITKTNSTNTNTFHFINYNDEVCSNINNVNSVEHINPVEFNDPSITNSIDFDTKLSSNPEDIGDSGESINDMINDYNRFKNDLNQTNRLNKQILDSFGNDIKEHKDDTVTFTSKKFTRKGGIDIKKNKLICCKN